MTWQHEQINLGLVESIVNISPHSQPIDTDRALFIYSGSNPGPTGQSGVYVVVYNNITQSVGEVLDLTDGMDLGDDVFSVLVKHITEDTWLGIWHEDIAGTVNIKARRFTVSGSTVTALGSAETILTGTALQSSIAAITFSGLYKAIVVYAPTTGNRARAKLLTDLDSGITVNSEVALTNPVGISAGSLQLSIAALDSTYAIIGVGYLDTAPNNSLACWLVSQSGTTLAEEYDLSIFRKNLSGLLPVIDGPLLRESNTTALFWWASTANDGGHPNNQEGIGITRLTRVGTTLSESSINSTLSTESPIPVAVPTLLTFKQDIVVLGSDLVVLDYSNFVDDGIVEEQSNFASSAPLGTTNKYSILSKYSIVGATSALADDGDWGVNILTDFLTTPPIPGVWQGGMTVFDLNFFTAETFAGIGTHTANDPMLSFSSYAGLQFANWVVANHALPSTSELSEVSFFATYQGITYAAVYFEGIYNNVKGITWV